MTPTERHIRTLEERLSNGWDVIEKRKALAVDVSALEDFWIDLLHDYEAACDEAESEAAA